jgi:hypothetical protein
LINPQLSNLPCTGQLPRVLAGHSASSNAGNHPLPPENRKRDGEDTDPDNSTGNMPPDQEACKNRLKEQTTAWEVLNPLSHSTTKRVVVVVYSMTNLEQMDNNNGEIRINP